MRDDAVLRRALPLGRGLGRLGLNDGTDLLYHHAKFGENRTTHIGVRRQSVLRFCVTLTQFDGVSNVVNYFNKT